MRAGCRGAQTAQWYDFYRNNRAVHATVVHFQLRNLLWATSAHDVYVMLDSAVNHWNPLTRKLTKVHVRLATVSSSQ